MISPDLIAAYRDTNYRVDTDPPIILRVSETSELLDTLLQEKGVFTAAFLTAWNPYSVMQDATANAAAHVELTARLIRDGIAFLPGEGVARGGGWPGEHSLLVLGVTRAEAEKLAHVFRQNAFVWISVGAAVELVLTR